MKMKHKILGALAAVLIAFSAGPVLAGGSYSFSFGYSSGHYRHGHHHYRHYRPYHHGWGLGYSYYYTPRYYYSPGYYYAPRYYAPPPPVTYYRPVPPPPAPAYRAPANPPTYLYEGGTFYRY